MSVDPEYLRRAREKARQAKHAAGVNGNGIGPAGAHGEPELTPEIGTPLSSVQPERVEWLWPGRIPRGKLSLLDGDPGLGKSVLTMDLAARVSSGQSMPWEPREPGEDRDPAGVVLLTAEDGLADTVVPRLKAAGADLDRVRALETVPDKPPRPPQLPEDCDWIGEAVKQVEAALVIIDPLMAYLAGGVNSHRDQDVRRALLPLAQLAQRTGAAVLVVRHLNKAMGGNPLYRGGGSIGIIGAARSGLLVARDPDNPDRRVLASTKCNLAKLPASLSFDLSAADNGGLRVGWIGESAHTAETLLTAPIDGEDRGAVAQAVEVLRSILADGPRPVKEVQREARKAGVSEVTLRRAKALLSIRSDRIGFGSDGVWCWSLPEVETG
jgi:hypothetical protein